MYRETPKYPLAEPLLYINDEKNLPAGVVYLGELVRPSKGKYIFYINQKDYLSIVYIYLNPIKKDGSYRYWQSDFPLKFLSWFPETLEKFRRGESPYRGFMTPEENVDGEMLAISRDMALGGPDKPGYTVYNFSRHQKAGKPLVYHDDGEEWFWPMYACWTEEFLFEGGLLDFIRSLQSVF